MTRRLVRVGLLPAFILLAAGCGDSDNRVGVSGTVLLKGQPLDQGSVQFIPTGPDGNGGGAVIENGKYSIPKQQGLKPAKYRIVISSGQAGTTAAPAAPGESGPPARERIPPEYNSNSEKKPVVREVTADGGPIDFDIK